MLHFESQKNVDCWMEGKKCTERFVTHNTAHGACAERKGSLMYVALRFTTPFYVMCHSGSIVNGKKGEWEEGALNK